MNSFAELGLVKPLQRALEGEKYTHPTPIQAQAIPHILAGQDLLGCARTGTGKTAAFALPILQRLSNSPPPPERKSARTLVLVPTRELAAQVAESFTVYGRGLGRSIAVVYGGVGQGPQVRAIERGIDILIATPGRLMDLMQQKHVRLDRLEILVLDEADQMLDLGFIPDIRRILAVVPKRRQTLLFSATMPTAIATLADSLLTKPAKVFVTSAGSTVESVEQRVHYVSRAAKPTLLTRVLRDPAIERVLVFTRTKRGADRVARRLVQDGIPSEAIHGNKSQNARERTLNGFRRGRLRVLVATDIAARGIDIDDITHVINYELPNVPETYVHRIGRTARAGATGIAISLCDGEERAFLRDIERLIKCKIEVVGEPDGPVTVADERKREREHVAAPQHRVRNAAPRGALPAGAARPARGAHSTSSEPRRSSRGHADAPREHRAAPGGQRSAPVGHHGRKPYGNRSGSGQRDGSGPRRGSASTHPDARSHRGRGAAHRAAPAAARPAAKAPVRRDDAHGRAPASAGRASREREASSQPFGAHVR
ncbi:MAG: DEAD/DEAH box helicase [Planctomycetota bacterium]